MLCFHRSELSLRTPGPGGGQGRALRSALARMRPDKAVWAAWPLGPPCAPGSPGECQPWEPW